MAHKLLQAFPNRRVILLEMRETIEEVKLIESEDKIERQHEILKIIDPKQYSNGKDNILTFDIFLDYSEYEWKLTPYDTSILKEIISSVSNTNSQIWLFRDSNYNQYKLDRLCKSQDHIIGHLTKDAQVQFLASYWAQNQTKLNTFKLMEYAQKSISTLKSLTGSNLLNGDIDTEIQTFLIADAFKKEALSYAKSELDDDSSPQLDKISSISDLYQIIIQERFENYFKQNGTLNMEQLKAMHIRLSLAKLFTNRYEHLQGYLDFPNFEEIVKVGIFGIDKILKDFRFLHESFAEYFVAVFVAENCNLEGKKDL